MRDVLSAATLSITGEMPALCAASGVTARCRRILERGGVVLPGEVETYGSADGYLSKLEEFTRPGRVCMQRVHAPDEVEARRYRVAPDVLSWLNDKANLASLVPAEAVPSRCVVEAEVLHQNRPVPPCVLKVATGDTTGGGRAVAICRNGDDVARALDRFEGVERMVVEEYLEIERSVCLSFGIFADGDVRYLGAAEQICGPDGTYYGNWIEGETVSEHAVRPAFEAMRRAAARGYVGFTGVDVAFTPEGVFVLDINARFNGSTAPVLFLDAIRARRGPVVARSSRLALPVDGWEEAVNRAIDEGRFIPLCIHDPGVRPEPAIAVGMVLGSGREDIEEYLATTRR